MKKLLSFVIVLMLLISTTSAYGAIPEFLTKSYTNYTAGYSVSVSCDNSDEWVDALLQAFDSEFLQIVDLKSIIKDLYSSQSDVNLQADMSNDFKKARIAITSEAYRDIDVSDNLNIKTKSKSGVWFNMDFTAEEPIFEVTCIIPYSNKYFYIDLMEVCTEEDKENLCYFVDYFLNEDFINTMKAVVLKGMEEHAEIKLSGNTCTVKLNNDGLVEILDLICHKIWEYANKLVIANSTEEVVYDGPDFTDFHLLGEKGLTCTFTLSGGKPVKFETVADFSVCYLEDMPAAKFSFKETASISKINATKVEFPALDAENTVDMTAEFKQRNAYKNQPDVVFYEREYPNYWVSAHTPSAVADVNTFCVPLRETLEYAYRDTVNITYDNGIITATSKYFSNFETLTLTIGSDTVYTDGSPHKIGTVIIHEGTTYVNCALFEDCFGWKIENATKDLFTGDCQFVFSTYDYIM